MKRIFISYRRDDTAPQAGRLADRLTHEVGRENVFLDLDSITAGDDFPTVIEDALRQSAVALVLIGPRWLRPGTSGELGIEDTDDWVRLEVGAALRRDDVRVVPVLLEGAPMPSAGDLPDDLKALTRRNAFPLTSLRWNREIDELLTVVRKALDAAEEPPTEVTHVQAAEPPRRDDEGRRRSRGPLIAVAGVAVAAAVAVAVLAGGGGGGDESNGPARSGKRAARVQRAQGSAVPPASSTTTTPATSTDSSPATGGFKACDRNIGAGGGATCPFAQNVFYEYFVSNRSNSISAYSPAVGRFFDLGCRELRIQVVCRVSTGAVVRIRKAAVEAYSQEQADNYAAHADTGHGD